MNYSGGDYVMGHLLRRARETGEGTLEVDVVRGTGSPATLMAEPVAAALARYAEWFPKHVASAGSAMDLIAGARMKIEFDLSRSRPARYAPMHAESPYVCRVDIEDNRGIVWSAELKDWWYPEAGEPALDGLPTVVRRLGQAIRSIWRKR